MNKYAWKMDLHMHSTVSDGTDTPEELLQKVRQVGIRLFALTDHDALKGYGMLLPMLQKHDPHLLSGVEFSCRDGEGKYHILGYGYQPDAPAIQQVVQQGHALRMQKLALRLEALRTDFGITFPEEDVCALRSLDNPGKPHLANLMVRYGFAASKEQAFERVLNHIRTVSGLIRPEEAIRGILQSGGVAVLAHPVYGSGEETVVGENLEKRVRRLMDFGLQGLEGFYSTYTPALRAEVLALAEKYGLYVTAGSDYHGQNKRIMLGDTHLNTAAEWPTGLLRFLERVGETDSSEERIMKSEKWR